MVPVGAGEIFEFSRSIARGILQDVFRLVEALSDLVHVWLQLSLFLVVEGFELARQVIGVLLPGVCDLTNSLIVDGDGGGGGGAEEGEDWEFHDIISL